MFTSRILIFVANLSGMRHRASNLFVTKHLVAYKGTSRTIRFQISLKFADASERLRNMLELEIRCGYSQTPVLQSFEVGTSRPYHVMPSLQVRGERKGELYRYVAKTLVSIRAPDFKF